MNKDVRSGLAIVCLAVIFGLIWLGMAVSDELAEVAPMMALIALIAAVAGLAVTIKGLLSD